MDASYVLPLHRTSGPPPAELTAYLGWLAARLDVIVVDDSPLPAFAAHALAWKTLSLRHVRPGRTAANPKVAGVLTGLDVATHDRVIVADDDVRYSEGSLADTLDRLESADLVRPQNYFLPAPWHARWDTARTLLNRALGRDYPGTLALRRATLARAGGYDGDVLFENLELIRTVEALGGAVASPLGCYVARRPPTAAHFWSQRVRQAYDDLGQPARLLTALSLLPVTTWLAGTRRWGSLVGAGSVVVVLAELGRRRCGGTAVFPPSASLFAPVWVLERGLCSWLAMGLRLFRGGCPYHGRVIRRAASSPRQLRRRLAAGVQPGIVDSFPRRGLPQGAARPPAPEVERRVDLPATALRHDL